MNMLKLRSVVGLGLCLGLLLCGTEGFSIPWPKLGRCPDMAVQQDFKLNDYEGIWYLQGGYNLEMVQGKGRCAKANYTFDQKDNILKVVNSQISARTKKWESISGYAVPDDITKDEGKLTVSLYLWGFWKVSGPYWVLDTDYYLYSVVYSCKNFLFFFHYVSVINAAILDHYAQEIIVWDHGPEKLPPSFTAKRDTQPKNI